MKTLKIISILGSFMLTLIASFLLAGAIGCSTGYVFAGLAATTILTQGFGLPVACFAIQQEIWVKAIMELIFKDNAFLNNCFNADAYVLNGRVVHIPNAAAMSGAMRNRTALPATVYKRTDIDVTYTLDEFTTNPIMIENIDQIELSYDKVTSLLQDNLGYLNQLIAEWLLYEWTPTAMVLSTNYLKTTGGSVAAHMDGSTGNRKLLLYSDLKKVKLLMNKANILKVDRFALLDSNTLDQLTDSLTVTQYRDFSQYYDPATGIIGKLEGFNIQERSSALRLSYDYSVIKSPDAAAAATDCAGSLFWQKNCVEKAIGTVEMFETIKDATMFGNVYSQLVRAGGRVRRADNMGVVILAQDTA